MLVNTLYPPDDGEEVLWERRQVKQVSDEYLEREFPLLRATEVAANALMTDGHGGLAWEIMQYRQSKLTQARMAEMLWHRRTFSTWRYFVMHFRGIAPHIHQEAAARKLGVSVAAVKDSIRYIEAHGWPEAAGEM